MAFWVKPGIDTSCFALQVLQLVNLLFPDKRRNRRIINFVNTIESDLKSFVFDRYDIKTGGFYQTSANQYPSLHATHCVISLIKALTDIKNNDRINFEDTIRHDVFDNFFNSSEFKINYQIRSQ